MWPRAHRDTPLVAWKHAEVALALVTVVNWTPMAQAAWWRASEAVTWLARLERGLQPWLPPDLLRRASA